jgi:UDP-3-O-[3-hydroxymyristoyl] N-acetylglucosamine deacetylase
MPAAHEEGDGMDGVPHSLRLQTVPVIQRTLKTAIDCVGVGLHTGCRARLVLSPAPAGTGIVFRRRDLGCEIPARFDRVVETRLCTVLGLDDTPAARVSTVEHVMAALAGAGVHNAVVEVDGPEVPILDGSAANFLFLIDCAGIVEQDEVIRAVEVLRTVRVAQGEAFAELRPAPFGLDMACSIAFEAPAIGRQALMLRLTPDSFRTELARARTFALAGEVDRLRAAGLAQGGTLDNAVVVDGERVLNPGGLRMADEFVRHKLLDAVGDLALAGAPLLGRFVAHRCGHALNNQLLRTLFADAANWRFAPAPTEAPIPAVRRRAEAA